MSQENVKLVHHWVDVFNSGDIASFVDLCDSEREFFSVTGTRLAPRALSWEGRSGEVREGQ